MKRSCPSSRGTALLITLIFMALITILFVGFVTSMSICRPAANAYLEKTRANLYAQAGVANALATLTQYTSSTNVTWVSQPGQLVVKSTATGPLAVSIPLSSMTNSASAAADASAPNLNLVSWRDSTDHVISNTAVGSDGLGTMKVNWVYVTQDGNPSQILQAGSWVPNPAYAPNAARNPIVGRYAYWTDDESTKVNLNLAWGKAEVSNTNTVESPVSVSLDALQDTVAQVTPAIAEAIHGHITPIGDYSDLIHFFDTPEAARQVGSATTALKHFKAEVTDYNHSPDLDVFNEPKIVLTTRPDRAGWTYKNGTWVGVNGLPGDWGSTNAGTPYFIRCLRNEGTISAPDTISGASGVAADPGLMTNIDTTGGTDHVGNTVAMLTSNLQRSDWPMLASGSGAKSFQDKYYPVGTGAGQYPNAAVAASRVPQLAVDIIDYVRSKESPQAVVPPLRVTLNSTTPPYTYTFGPPPDNVDGNTFIGSARMPFITELGAWVDHISDGYASMSLTVEIYNPPNYGMGNLSLKQLALGYTFKGYNFANAAVASTGSLAPGQYVAIRRTIDGIPSVNDITVRPTSIPARVFLGPFRGSTSAVDEVDVAGYESQYTNEFVYLPVDPDGTATNNITSMEVDDPRINSPEEVWTNTLLASGAHNTFNMQNPDYSVGKTPSPAYPGAPPQDTDANGNISAASFYMPPPAGTTNAVSSYTAGCAVNPLGYVTSVGELGYIDTGIESDSLSYSPPDSTNQVPMPMGTPWRTVHLQPSSADASTVPDWALMDIFTVPSMMNTNALPISEPNGTSVGGRVNINSKIQPFADSQAAPFDEQRTLPLAAVLQGATNDATVPGATLSAASAQTIAQNIYYGNLASSGKHYPGGTQTAYGSPGEVVEVKGVADGGEGTEELVRQIIGHISARGEVFTIFSVGQSLKETLNGTLIVTGEQRVQSMVERYQPNSTSNATRYRTIYFRDLTP